MGLVYQSFEVQLMILRILVLFFLLVVANVINARSLQLAYFDETHGWHLTPNEAARGITGRILGVQTIVENGRTLYVYKVLTPDGRIRYVKVDSATGRHL